MRAHILRRLILSSVMLAAVAGTVQAQDDVPEGLPTPTVTIDVAAHDEPVEPITGLGLAELTVTVTCEAGTVRADAEAFEVALEVVVDEGEATVVLVNETVAFDITPEECLAGTEVSEDGLFAALYADAAAPAGSAIGLTATATPDSGDPASVMWNETVGVYMRSEAQFDEPLQESRAGDIVRYPGTITNDGNSAVTVTFSLPEDQSELTEVEVPVEAELAAGASDTFEVVVAAPEASGTYDLVITVDFVSTDEPEATQMVPLTAALDNEAVAEESPAPALGTVLVVLVGLAALRRR